MGQLIKQNGHPVTPKAIRFFAQEKPIPKETCDVRAQYSHLNPLRAGLVADYRELGSYPFCGHSAILGKHTRDWQKVDYMR